MNLLKEAIYKLLTRAIDFLIDAREYVDDTPVICLHDWMEEHFGPTDFCPWCEGMGLLTEDGEPLNEEKLKCQSR